MVSSEEELLIAERIRLSDNRAARDIYDAYAGYLTGVCARYVSDNDDLRDVIQDSFLKIFSSLSSFSFRGPGSLRAWLSKIVVNQSLSFLNNKGKLNFVPLDDIEWDIADNDIDIGNIPDDVLMQLIRDLPTGYRTVFNLYVYEGKSHKEIASILNIKENSSASQFHRAKAILAARIKEYIKNETATPYGR